MLNFENLALFCFIISTRLVWGATKNKSIQKRSEHDITIARPGVEGECMDAIPPEVLAHSLRPETQPAEKLPELALYTDGACKGNRNVAIESCPAG